MNLRTWMAMACTVVVSATASLAGCSSPTEPRSLVVTDSPDEPETDPAPEPIANSPDASSPDAAPSLDAGAPEVDVSTEDAGDAAPDATDAVLEPDAGSADAGADAAPIEAGPRHLVQCDTPQGSFTACNGANMAAEGVGSISYAAPTEVGSHLCDDSAPDVAADCATGDNCVVYIVATQTNDYGTCQ